MSVESYSKSSTLKLLTVKIISQSLRYFDHQINNCIQTSNLSQQPKSRSTFYHDDEEHDESTLLSSSPPSSTLFKTANKKNCEKTEEDVTNVESQIRQSKSSINKAERSRCKFYKNRNNADTDFDNKSDNLLSNRSSLSNSNGKVMHIGRAKSNRKIFWSDSMKISNININGKLDIKERNLVEAKYELITSEAIYLDGLNIFKAVFIDSKSLSSTVEEPHRWNEIFSDILEIRKVSENFLHELAGEMERDYLLKNIVHIVRVHAQESFELYIRYCSRFLINDGFIAFLQQNNRKFAEELARIESSECYHSLREYLVTPIQRITRIPLLIEAIRKNINNVDKEFTLCEVTIGILKEIVRECNQSLDINKCSRS